MISTRALSAACTTGRGSCGNAPAQTRQARMSCSRASREQVIGSGDGRRTAGAQPRPRAERTAFLPDLDAGPCCSPVGTLGLEGTIMPDLALAPAWTALFLGLFALFAGIGELRQGGHWQKLLEEMSASPALQLITALLELFLGAAIYIVNPWASADWLSGVMSVLGGLMIIEALVV